MKLPLTFSLAVGVVIGSCTPVHLTPEQVFPDDNGPYLEPFDAPIGTGYAVPKCAQACANIQAKRCPEATTRPGEDSCYVVCSRAEATGKIDFKTQCVAAAKSQSAIRACGTYRCGAVR